ncbi:MAG: hypothetical protein AAF914_11550 [Pseudomonadota bacterium]
MVQIDPTEGDPKAGAPADHDEEAWKRPGLIARNAVILLSLAAACALVWRYSR